MLHWEVRLRSEYVGHPLEVFGHMADVVVGAHGTVDVLSGVILVKEGHVARHLLELCRVRPAVIHVELFG